MISATSSSVSSQHIMRWLPSNSAGRSMHDSCVRFLFVFSVLIASMVFPCSRCSETLLGCCCEEFFDCVFEIFVIS